MINKLLKDLGRIKGVSGPLCSWKSDLIIKRGYFRHRFRTCRDYAFLCSWYDRKDFQEKLKLNKP